MASLFRFLRFVSLQTFLLLLYFASFFFFSLQNISTFSWGTWARKSRRIPSAKPSPLSERSRKLFLYYIQYFFSCVDRFFFVCLYMCVSSDAYWCPDQISRRRGNLLLYVPRAESMIFFRPFFLCPFPSLPDIMMWVAEAYCRMEGMGPKKKTVYVFRYSSPTSAGRIFSPLQFRVFPFISSFTFLFSVSSGWIDWNMNVIRNCWDDFPGETLEMYRIFIKV